MVQGVNKIGHPKLQAVVYWFDAIASSALPAYSYYLAELMMMASPDQF